MTGFVYYNDMINEYERTDNDHCSKTAWLSLLCQNGPGVNPVDNRVWIPYRTTFFIKVKCETLMIVSGVWLMRGTVCSRASFTTLLASARLRLRGGVRVQGGIFDMVCYLHLLEKRWRCCNWWQTYIFWPLLTCHALLMWKNRCFWNMSFHKVV